MVPGGVDVAIDAGSFHEPKSLLHKTQKALLLETDVPETLNEAIMSVKKMGRVGIIAAYAGYANGVNVGALMEKGVRLIGNGQAPVHLYVSPSLYLSPVDDTMTDVVFSFKWNEILNDYIIPGKFDPTLYVPLTITSSCWSLTLTKISRLSNAW